MSEDENKGNPPHQPYDTKEILVALAAALAYPALVLGLFWVAIQESLVGVLLLYIANIAVLIMAVRRHDTPYRAARGFLIFWGVIALIIGGILLLLIQACSSQKLFG
jgi:hypothetical protein